MPTILTHPAVALTKTWFPRLSRRVAVAGVLGSIAPDLDVLAFRFGIPYGHTFGHRGFTHSIAFALFFAALAALFFREHRLASFAFVFFCTMSHGILDAFTDGGLGVAFFSPLSNERYFFPWTPIRVSPLGAGFFSARGLETLRSEALWVWMPAVVVGFLGHFARRKQV